MVDVMVDELKIIGKRPIFASTCYFRKKRGESSVLDMQVSKGTLLEEEQFLPI